MLCRSCYKKIPEGKEIRRARNNFFRTSWGYGWGGNEIVCKKCCIKWDKQDRALLIAFFTFMIGFLIIPIVIITITKKWN